MQVERKNSELEIIRFIKTQLVPENTTELAPDVELIAGGVLDSVAMVELVVWIEESYGLSVAIDDLTPETFGTVRKIAAYIDKQSPSPSAEAIA